MNTRKSAIEKEWLGLVKSEEKFAVSRMKAKPQFLNEKLDTYIPEKLQSTLNTAFCKAFEIIFEKGTNAINKSYNKEKKNVDYKIGEYTLELNNNRKNIKSFTKKANGAKNANTLISGASGIGMGLIGLGIPDIPVFTAMILKSIYETAIGFGFDYEETSEQLFILKIIEVSMKTGVDFANANKELNGYIDKKIDLDIPKNIQIKNTSESLADSMLYMKFLQGIPIVGTVGGAYDFIYMDRITKYAILKYKRRFIIKKMH